MIESTPVCGVAIRKAVVAPLLAPSRRRDMAVDITPHEHWGFQSGKDVDKTVGITFYRLENGVIYIVEGVNAVLSAKVEQAIDLGTHTLFIAEVTDAFSTDETPSATYAYYHKRIKPAPQQPKKRGLCARLGRCDCQPQTIQEQTATLRAPRTAFPSLSKKFM